MILREEKINCPNCINAYNEKSIEIQGKIYTQNIVVNPIGSINLWTQKKISQLTINDFSQFLGQSLDFVIFGTGKKHRFLEPQLIRELYAKGLYLETMNSGACCRVFRILAEENRRFLAIITIEERDN